MIDLTIRRGTLRPQFRPALERLEGRVVPTVTASEIAIHTVDITNADGTVTTVMVSYGWDVNDIACQAAVALIVPYDEAEQALQLATNTALGSIGDDGVCSDSSLTAFENAVDASVTAEYNYFNSLASIQQSISDWVNSWCDLNPVAGTDPVNVTIDPSVVNLATAQARVKDLLTQAKTVADRDAQMSADIRGSDFWDSLTKSYAYSDEAHANALKMKSIQKELKLIKAQYPGVSR
jgi:hypothetical protein